MFDTFDGEAKQILTNAKLEMKKLKHPYIGSEHLLLAILKTECNISEAFKNHDITYDIFKNKMTEVIGVGSATNLEMFLYTPLLKRVLENATIDSKENNCDVTIKQLTLSLLEEGEGVAIRLLNSLNLNIDDLYQELLEIEDREKNQIRFLEEVKEERKLKMNYIYNIVLAFNENKNDYIKKMPCFKVNKNDFKILEDKKVFLNEDFLEEIKNISSLINSQSVKSFTGAIFAYDKAHIAIKFDNKGECLSKCCMLLEESEEVFDVLGYSNDVLKDFIKSSINSENIIYSTDSVYNQEKEQEKIKEHSASIEKQKRDSFAKLDKLNCFVNVNESVKKNNTVIVGLDDELEQLTKILLKTRKPNAIILGEPGVGKTALVEKFALTINNRTAPKCFWDKSIYELQMSNAVAGTKYRGEFEDKMRQVIKTLEENPNVILFIDEIHTMVGAGGAEGAIDASNIFKPSLARGTIRVIGATTNDEYRDTIEKDGALNRRFDKVHVIEPTKEQVLDIMQGMKSFFEKTYDVTITNSLIQELYDTSKRKAGHMPDLAIDELENWCVDKYYFDNIVEKQEERV